MTSTPAFQASGVMGLAGMATATSPPGCSGAGQIREQSKFHAAAHGIDTLGTDADTIAELPDQGIDLLALALGVAPFVARDRDNGVVAFTVKAAGAGEFLESTDGN